jgi:hypothetical protein
MNAFKKKVEQAVTVKIEQVPQEKGPEFFSANLQKKKQLAKTTAKRTCAIKKPILPAKQK